MPADVRQRLLNDPDELDLRLRAGCPLCVIGPHAADLDPPLLLEAPQVLGHDRYEPALCDILHAQAEDIVADAAVCLLRNALDLLQRAPRRVEMAFVQA